MSTLGQNATAAFILTHVTVAWGERARVNLTCWNQIKHTHKEKEKEVGVCMWLVHTRVCAFDIIVKNCSILSSSRHTQQAGLRRRRVPNNEETLQGDTQWHFSIRSVTEACWAGFLCNVHAAKLDDVAPWQPGSAVGNTDDFLKECGGNQHCVSVSVTGLNWSWKCVTMTDWNQTESHVNSTFSRVHKSWLCGRPSLLLMHCRHSWRSAFQILIDLQRFLNY